MEKEPTTQDKLAKPSATAHWRRDGIARAQMWLPIAVISVVVILGVVELCYRGDERYSPGPLADVHATWDNRCSACHTTAAPLNQHNWTRTVFDTAHAGDAQCRTCHDGPAHHEKQQPADVAGCTACHREHRGRNADLKRVADHECLSCHRELTRHLKDGTATAFGDITGFVGGQHKEFRWSRERSPDPGRIAFNHKLHMTPGLRDAAGSAAPVVLGDLPAEFRERYRTGTATDKDAVRLDCASCHRTDAPRNAPAVGLPANAVQPARPSGEFMLPIVYEQHCQACHPLTFAARDAHNPQAELPQVRHRLQPDEIRTWLRGYFTERALVDRLPFFEQPARPLPGKKAERDAQAKKVGEVLERSIDAAERILYGSNTCGQCHTALRPGLGPKQRVEPADIPAVWFKNARFDHTAHRAVACATCHAGATESRSQADVLLPGVQVCQSCHAPAGARHDCVECHRYHGGDDPLHGRGAASRQPPHGAMTDLRKFMLGTNSE